MTDDKIALRAFLEKGSDTKFLCDEPIGFAAERLLALETEQIPGWGPAERTAERRNERTVYRDHDWDTSLIGSIFSAAFPALQQRLIR